MAVTEITTTVERCPAEDVLSLLREQVELFARLEGFAGRQRNLVTGEDPGRLLSLLADRQKLSSELQRIATILEPVRRDWPSYRTNLTGPQRIEADKLLEDATNRLERIIESDEQDAKLLSVRREAAARTLRTAHSAGQAMRAYREPAKRTGRLDCVDEDPR